MMKKIMLFASVLGVVLATGCVESQGDEGDDVELGETERALRTDVRVQIKSMINTSGQGLCLDIAGGGSVIGTPIVQYPCHRGLNQQWKIVPATFTNYQIVSIAHPTRCVGFTGNAADNTLLRLAACIDATGLKPLPTRFELVGNDLRDEVSHAAFRSAVTPGTKCIDVASGLNWHSLWMQLFTCHGGSNQKWELMHW